MKNKGILIGAFLMAVVFICAAAVFQNAYTSNPAGASINVAGGSILGINNMSVTGGLQISDSAVPTNVMLSFGPSMTFYAQTNHSGGGPGGIESEGVWNNQGGWALIGGQDFNFAAGGQLGYSGKTHEIIHLQYDFVPSSLTNYDVSGLWGYSKFLTFTAQAANINDSLIDSHVSGFREEIPTNDGVAVLAIYPDVGWQLPHNEWKHTFSDGNTPVRGGFFGNASFNYIAGVFTNTITVGHNVAADVSVVSKINGDLQLNGTLQVTDPSDANETSPVLNVDPSVNSIIAGRQSTTSGKSLQSFKVIDRFGGIWFQASPAGGTLSFPQYGAAAGTFWECTDSGGDGAWVAVTNLSTLVVGNPTNTPSFTLVNTNWVSGKLYTNATGRPIMVIMPCQITMTGVAGNATFSLLVTGVTTNSLSMTTLITSLATSLTNQVSALVAAGGTFTGTNLSAGAGDSSATVNGGQYMVY